MSWRHATYHLTPARARKLIRPGVSPLILFLHPDENNSDFDVWETDSPRAGHTSGQVQTKAETTTSRCCRKLFAPVQTQCLAKNEVGTRTKRGNLCQCHTRQ
jgi:hypothetical protein